MKILIELKKLKRWEKGIVENEREK